MQALNALKLQFPVKRFGIFMQQLNQPGNNADKQPSSSAVLKNA